VSNIRSTPIKGSAPGRIQREYNRVSLALAIFATLCFFCALWGINGFFTARAVASAGTWLHVAALSWPIGWLIHIIVSLIEQHLWRLREHLQSAPPAVYIGVYTLIVVVGVLDVFTSALSILLLITSVGLSPTAVPMIVISTLLSEVIAIFPEPVIVWLTVTLYRVIRA